MPFICIWSASVWGDSCCSLGCFANALVLVIQLCCCVSVGTDCTTWIFHSIAYYNKCCAVTLQPFFGSYTKMLSALLCFSFASFAVSTFNIAWCNSFSLIFFLPFQSSTTFILLNPWKDYSPLLRYFVFLSGLLYINLICFSRLVLSQVVWPGRYVLAKLFILHLKTNYWLECMNRKPLHHLMESKCGWCLSYCVWSFRLASSEILL